jgi:hypothetical protein
VETGSYASCYIFVSFVFDVNSDVMLSRFGRNKQRSSDNVVDIEHLLVKYAWTELAEPTCLDRLMKTRKYKLEVNWAYFDISHQVTSFKPRPRDISVLSDSPPVVRRNLCLFRTEFKNASSEAQTFTFKTERTTTSRCEINLQRSYRIGTNIDVRVSIPPVRR